ncbi:penicillin-binding protein 2 [Natroniella sulfidigena]|uniref:penicillin-binding protein 2 n=1 Tax=Natroniella sulfidigena TaxID=723921 RepID=UPI00200B3D3F|nr:penicillin-binding protein 2 [Natroniella sulfidigena]
MKNDSERRLFHFTIIVVLIFGVLFAQLYYLQIYNGELYKRLSEGNRTSILPISAPRGKIYDRSGEVLVSNKMTYTASLIPDEIDDLDYVLEVLEQILEIDQLELEDKIIANKKDKLVRLKRNISQEELIMLEENKEQIPGLIIENIPIRSYVKDNLASHILGYVGEISANELSDLNEQGYRAGDILGKTGLELIYEDYLRGERGRQQVEVNNLGQQLRVLGVEDPEPGHNLVLNIDHQLQQTTEELLADKVKVIKKELEDEEHPPIGGAAIVSNPKNGDVLAMASFPDYNPNLFSTGISRTDWEELNSDLTRPLLNRAVNTSAPSGSVFKVVTSAAALEELEISGDDEFYDPGFYELAGTRFGNWYSGGQGEIDFIDSLAWSNNTVFYKLGHKLYKEDQTILQHYARQFGLGDKTGIDLKNEAEGLVPDPDWRRNYFQGIEDRIWYPGYTINMSIGQGNLRVSPIQLTNTMNAIANEGKIYQPLLADKVVDQDGNVVQEIESELINNLSLSEETMTVIQEGLEGVVTYGTARDNFSEVEISLAGKTGTAQTGRNNPNHGWFGGYAPADDPEISIVVFLEYGISSGNTLPIVEGIMQEYFDLEDLDDDQKEG